jgi:HEAT repeat protein
MPLIRKPSPGTATTPQSPPFDPVSLIEGTNDVRWAAARAAAARPDGVVLLTKALTRERNSRVREAIFTGLASIGTAESASAAIPYLRSEYANVRTGAIDALRAMPVATAVHLPALLADPDPDVRLLSCELARAQPAHEANRLLCAILDTDLEKNVCAAALDVIAETGGPEVLVSLDRCAQRFKDDPFLVFSIKVVRDQIGALSSRE